MACWLGDVAGVCLQGLDVASLPDPCPRLDTLGGLPSEEVIHGLGAAAEQRDDVQALLLGEAVGLAMRRSQRLTSVRW